MPGLPTVHVADGMEGHGRAVPPSNLRYGVDRAVYLRAPSFPPNSAFPGSTLGLPKQRLDSESRKRGDLVFKQPRTSGARFSPSGVLVCLHRAPPRHLGSKAGGSRGKPIRPVGSTRPRQLSTSERRNSDVRIGMPSRGGLERSYAAVVVLYDTSVLESVDEFVGTLRVSPERPLESVRTVSIKCAAADRPDMERAASLAALLHEFGEEHWVRLPLGKALYTRQLKHFVEKMQDVQSAAMLCAMFTVPSLVSTQALPELKEEAQSVTEVNGFDEEHCDPRRLSMTPRREHGSVLDETSQSAPSTRYCVPRSALGALIRRSNSWTKLELDADEPPPPLTSNTSASCLSTLEMRLHDSLLSIYAEKLLATGRLQQRTELVNLRYSVAPPQYSGALVLMCKACTHPELRLNCCCAPKPIVCTICRLTVRGKVQVCLMCGHGGHVSHYSSWFTRKEATCPVCDCSCGQPPPPKADAASPKTPARPSGRTHHHVPPHSSKHGRFAVTTTVSSSVR